MPIKSFSISDCYGCDFTAAILEQLECRQLLSGVVWSVGPELPEARTDAAAVITSDNAVRLIGGNAASPTSAPLLAANAIEWSLGHDTDTARNDLGAVISGNSVYLYGGTGNDEGSDEALSYDYRLGDSQDVAKMNRIRYDFGFAVDGSGRAYAIGGIGVFEDGEIWSQAERYNPAIDSWSSIASLPDALHGQSAIGDGNGHIFVFGGSTTLDDSGIQSNSFSYDVASNTWANIASLPIATRDSAVVMDHTGLIYVTGGMTAAGAADSVQVYNPSTNNWTSETSLPSATYSHAAAFDASGRIIVAGGFDASGTATSTVYRSQSLTVSESAPVITTNPVASASLDRFYTYDVESTGNPDPAFSLVTAPQGMSIDALTGVINWQPVVGQLGVHAVTIRAANRVGSVDQMFDINVLADTFAPTTPTNFVVDSTTETTVTLSWTASTDAVGVDHYEVFSAIYTGPRFGKHWVYTLEDTVTSTTSTITGLSPLSSKKFTVQAVDAMGNYSGRATFVTATTQSVPTLSFSSGTQTTGTVEAPAKHPLEIQLRSQANPSATFSMVNGPPSMTVDPTMGLAQWTPDVADIGIQAVTFRASNSVGSTDLDVMIEVISDVPQLSITYNPSTGGARFALAGTLFTAQINDVSASVSTYEMIASPAGMTIDAATGLISWTPIGSQGGTHGVTVRGTNSGGTTDLTFNVDSLFTSAVTNVTVSDTTLLNPTATWIAATGEGSELVGSYQINGSATWGVGRTEQTHHVSYTVPASETSILMTGLVTGKAYTLTVTALDAAENPGLANTGTVFVSSPALPQVRWAVNGIAGGLSVPGTVVAGQTASIVLTDNNIDPSTITLVSGPTGLIFDPVTNTAQWTPGADDVTTGYTSTTLTFSATNSVGSVNVSVPIRVFFSGPVQNAVTTRFDNNATASWDSPADNITPIVGYSITRHWTWSGRPRSLTWTVGNVTSIAFSLTPTGAVSHKGVDITPIDANGNLGVSSGKILYGQATNNLAPIAVDDAYDATVNVTLAVDIASGVRANDIDTDNTPYFNPLTTHVVSQTAHGTLSLITNGSFTYVPDADFHGVDTFTYRVYDGKFYSDNAMVTINVAPLAKVTRVTVGSTSWSSSFTNAADAADGVIDGAYTIPTGNSEQLATLPWTNINEVSITFSEDVHVTLNNLGVIGVNRLDYTTDITSFAYDESNLTATWGLSAALPVDKLILFLRDDVTSVESGAALDGEWSESVSTQSGDDIAGGDFQFRLNVLPGDANQTQIVAGDDVLAVAGRIISFPGVGAYNIFNDINGDALIAGNDALLVIDQIITFLPGGEPSPPARISRLQQQGLSRVSVSSSNTKSALPEADNIDNYTALIQTLSANSGSTSSTTDPETPDMASYWDSILEMDPIEINETR